MKKDMSETEERLLNSASLDELIKIKMEQEMSKEFSKNKDIPKLKKITNIKDVPKEKIFSKFSVFKVFNRILKTETFINGIQADALTGLQTAVREKIASGQSDAFSTDDVYVKFESIDI